jgi:hypothetical protein
MEEQFVVTHGYSVLLQREKIWQIPNRQKLKHVMFLRNYKEKQFFFVDTTFWLTVCLWSKYWVILESHFDQLLEMRQIAVSWPIWLYLSRCEVWGSSVRAGEDIILLGFHWHTGTSVFYVLPRRLESWRTRYNEMDRLTENRQIISFKPTVHWKHKTSSFDCTTVNGFEGNYLAGYDSVSFGMILLTFRRESNIIFQISHDISLRN